MPAPFITFLIVQLVATSLSQIVTGLDPARRHKLISTRYPELDSGLAARRECIDGCCPKRLHIP